MFPINPKRLLTLMLLLATLIISCAGVFSAYTQIDWVFYRSSTSMFRVSFDRWKMQIVIIAPVKVAIDYRIHTIEELSTKSEFNLDMDINLRVSAGQISAGFPGAITDALIPPKRTHRFYGAAIWKTKIPHIFDLDWINAGKFSATTKLKKPPIAVHLLAVVLPLWIVVILFGYYPIIVIGSRKLRGRYRRKRNRCVTCGYDLTGNSSGICPECGTAIDTHTGKRQL